MSGRQKKIIHYDLLGLRSFGELNNLLLQSIAREFPFRTSSGNAKSAKNETKMK